jgi:DNA-directed RNA polymerase subunit alpha
MEVWTDGSLNPIETLRQAGNILVGHFFLFANTQRPSEDGAEGAPIALRISPEHYNIAVERMELSSRTLNCLKRASIDKVGQILELSKAELLQIRNFGEKSLSELYDRLRERDLLPPDLDPDVVKEEEPEEAEAAEAVDEESPAEEQEAPAQEEAEVVAVGLEMPRIEGQGDES